MEEHVRKDNFGTRASIAATHQREAFSGHKAPDGMGCAYENALK